MDRTEPDESASDHSCHIATRAAVNIPGDAEEASRKVEINASSPFTAFELLHLRDRTLELCPLLILCACIISYVKASAAPNFSVLSCASFSAAAFAFHCVLAEVGRALLRLEELSLASSIKAYVQYIVYK